MNKGILFFLIISTHNVYAFSWKMYKDNFQIPYIIANVDNEKHFFQLDTGSVTGLHLNIKTFNKLENKCKYRRELKTIDLTGTKNLGTECIIDSLIINNEIFHNISITNLKNWGLTSATEKPDTEVIGIDLFKKGSLVLDYINGYISYKNGSFKKNKINAKESYKFELNRNGIVIKDNVQDLNLIIDTGSTVSMIWKKTKSIKDNNCTAIFPISIFPKTKDEDCTTTDFYLKTLSGEIIPFPAMYIKDHDKYPDDIDGLIGGSFFMNKKITIDFLNQIMFIEK